MNNGSGMGGPSQSLRSGDPPALSRSLSPHSPGMPSFSATPHSSTTPTLHTTGHEESDSDGTPPASSSPSVSASPIPSMEDPHTRPASSQAHEALDSQGTAAKEVVGPKAREAQAGEPSSSAVLDPGLVPGGATVSPGLSPSRELTSRPMSVSVDGQVCFAPSPRPSIRAVVTFVGFLTIFSPFFCVWRCFFVCMRVGIWFCGRMNV